MLQQKTLSSSTRLSGIDLFRGLAAYGVVMLHSGDASIAPVAVSASAFRSILGFPVPFFLAASFYLLVDRSNHKTPLQSLIKRFQRLVIPYILWSLLYLLFKFFQVSVLKGSNQLSDLLKDPVSLVFFGSAGVHLYFLPLLFFGSIALIGLEAFWKRPLDIKELVSLTIMSIILSQMLLLTGNSYQLGPNVAFQALLPGSSSNQTLRVFLVMIAWMVQCLPYIFLAKIARHSTIQRSISDLTLSRCVVLVVLFIGINLSNLWPDFPQGLALCRELSTAYLGLFVALSLSRYIPNSPFVRDVGAYSFGIYLIHVAVVRVLWSFLLKITPSFTSEITISSILLLSASSFLISWLLVSVLKKQKHVSKLLFSA